MTNAIAIIPARMGSIRVPGKNLRHIGGTSLIQHAINYAWKSDRFRRVIVSTDRPDLIDGLTTGADVIERPAGISGPNADISAAITHAFHHDGGLSEFAACLQPAVMARSASIIADLMDACADSNCCGITMAASNPWQWTVRGSVAEAPWLPGAYPRSQDAGERLSEVNAVQISTREAVLSGKRWIPPLAIARLPAWCAALDIDTEEDLAIAEQLWPWAKDQLHGYQPRITINEVPQC
jgi:CMP-N-acetylneuraminic acid synthetase